MYSPPLRGGGRWAQRAGSLKPDRCLYRPAKIADASRFEELSCKTVIGVPPLSRTEILDEVHRLVAFG